MRWRGMRTNAQAASVFRGVAFAIRKDPICRRGRKCRPELVRSDRFKEWSGTDTEPAYADCARDDAADTASGGYHVHHPFSAHCSRTAFPAAGARTQTAPSNQVLVGLSLFLSLLIVQPLFSDIYTHAWQPLEKGEITAEQAVDAGSAPLRKFLVRFAREKDIRLFVEISNEPAPHSPADVSLRVLIPAYILSELKAGFQIGAVLFLPFLVIDMAVASVTVSIGMMQLPPALISAPFKILLFVLVDGWSLVVGSLMKSFLPY